MTQPPHTPPSPGGDASESARVREAQRVARDKALYQQQRAENRRRHQRAGGRDMLLSLAVLLVPVVGLVMFFQTTPDKAPVAVAQVSPAAAQARASAGFVPLVPTNLPNGWTPIRAAFAPAGGQIVGMGTVTAATWVVGYQSPDGIYYEVRQQAGSSASFLQDATRHGSAGGTSSVSGASWTQYTGDDDRTHSLVRIDGSGASQSTVVVSSTAGFEALASFVATLSGRS